MKRRIKMITQNYTGKILSGRTTNRAERQKHYNSIRFSGWTINKKNLIGMLKNAANHDLNSIKQAVRVTISEAEGAVQKLSEYQKILEQLNSTAYSNRDVQIALNGLKSSSLDQTDIHTP